MAVDGVREFVHRTMQDEAFLNRFRTDPEAALADFDLTEAEYDALASRDSRRIREVTGDEVAADHIHDFFSVGPVAQAFDLDEDGTVRRRSAD